MIAITMVTAMASVVSTSRIAPLMNTASSLVTKTLTSGGRMGCNSSTTARTAREISSVLVWACRMIPRPRPVWPLARSTLSPGAGPSVTVATSPKVTPSRIASASNSAALVTVAVVRTTMLWLEELSAPAGASKATLRSVLRISARLRPRLASCIWSMSIRNTASRSP